MNKLDEIEYLFEDLSSLLNQECTGRSIMDDLADVTEGLQWLKDRIDSEENQDVYEEDKINLGWAVDFIDYLWKIYKVVKEQVWIFGT